MNVSEFIWEYLADHGVKHVPYLPGGGAMYLVDALIRNKRLTPVCCLHEQAAGIMADSIAQLTGTLGVCLTTSGPGATNAVTPCAAAWIDSTPMLFISGQVATSQRMKPGQRQGGPQEVDILSIVGPITKMAVGAHGHKGWIEAAFPLLIQAAHLNPSGPVWLDVPLDVQSARI